MIIFMESVVIIASRRAEEFKAVVQTVFPKKAHWLSILVITVDEP